MATVEALRGRGPSASALRESFDDFAAKIEVLQAEATQEAERLRERASASGAELARECQAQMRQLLLEQLRSFSAELKSAHAVKVNEFNALAGSLLNQSLQRLEAQLAEAAEGKRCLGCGRVCQNDARFCDICRSPV